MKCTSCTTTGCYREVLLSCFNSFLLVSTCNRMLESCRVGRVTGNGYVYVLLPHDSNTFRNGVCTIAVNLCTKSLGVCLTIYFLNSVCVRIIFCFYKCKSIDSGNDLCSILSKTVQDNTKRFLTNLVCLLSNTNCTFCCCE